MVIGWLAAAASCFPAVSGCRGPGVGKLLAPLVGLAYLAGCRHFWLDLHGMDAPWSPPDLWDAIVRASGKGHPTHRLTGRTGHVDPVDGMFLRGPWVVEAVGVLFFSSSFSAGVGATPYCERCDKECDEKVLRTLGSGAADFEARNALRETLKARDFACLHAKEEPGSGNCRLVVSLWACPSCRESDYLTAEIHQESERTVTDPKGNTSTETTTQKVPLVERMRVDAAEADSLRGQAAPGAEGGAALPSDGKGASLPDG